MICRHCGVPIHEMRWDGFVVWVKDRSSPLCEPESLYGTQIHEPMTTSEMLSSLREIEKDLR